jgi:hypothetical protein
MESDLRAERVQRLAEQLAAGRSVEQQLAAGEERDLVSLAALAHQLAQTLPVAPPPAFRARLQADLQQSLLAQHPARRPRPLWSRWLPRMAAATLALVVLLGSTVVASASSLPGDVLYPVKRVTENVRLLLSWSAQAWVAVQLDIADARLAELRALADQGRAADEAALVAAVARAHEAARAAASEASDPALVASVEAQIAADEVALHQTEPNQLVPDEARADTPTLQPATATALPAATATETAIMPAATATLHAQPSLPPATALPTHIPTSVAAATDEPAATSEPPGGSLPVVTVPTPAPINTDVPAPPAATSTLSPGELRLTERASYTTPVPTATPTRRPRRPRHDPPPAPGHGSVRPTSAPEPSATP